VIKDVAFLQAALTLAGVIIGALLSVLLWFVRKDRNAAFTTLRSHRQELDELRSDVRDLNTVVFGRNDDGGVDKWELKARNLLQPILLEVTSMKEKFELLRLVIVRAVPNINLSDILK
jgi:hypothetical protein